MDENDSVVSKVIRRTYRVPASIIGILTLIYQACVINYYLVSYYNNWWLLWIIADVIVVGLFMAAFIVCYIYLMSSNKKNLKCRKILGGELPLAYISWFVYSVFLATRVAIIYYRFAFTLKEENFFGPNMLKTTISVTSIVFLCVVMAHSDTKPSSERDTYITLIIFRVGIDILDTVSLLDVLFIEESHVFLSFEMNKTLVAIGCINLMLPTIPLAVLSWTNFGKSEMRKILDTLHIVLYFFAVNLPLLVIRLILWHVHSEIISVFIIKNVLSIALTIKKIHDHIAEIYEDKLAKKEKKSGDVEMENLKNNSQGQPTTELSEGQARSVFI